ncbi:hypothetical protein Tco_0062171, partial [Tanacetum coccineum]
ISVNAEETVEEPLLEMAMDVEEPILDDVVYDVGQPQDDADPKKTCFNDLVNFEKGPLTFDDMMATPIDFTKFSMNRPKKDKIAKADFVGPVYKLLKGTCRNPPSHLTIPVDFFFNNDLEYLKIGNSERKYIVSITKTKAVRYELEGIEDMIPRLKSRHDVYSTMKILSVIRVKVNKQFGYGYLEDIVVRRADQQEYTFKEGDFPRIHLKDIEEMLLLHVQNN